MATNWSVVVFGDSWVAYSHPTWPQVLARRLGAQFFNFAFPGAVSANLPMQAQQAMMQQTVPRAPGGLFRRETLVVVHTGGNDFIAKMAQVIMGGGHNLEILKPEPGREEAANIEQLLEKMYEAGARNFLVSGVPAFIHMPVFNLIWGIITNLVNSGQLEELGVSPGDPPSLPMEVQAAALNERWSNLCEAFSKRHTDVTCSFFDEVEALHSLRAQLGESVFDRSMWDFSMFHPSVFGHERIADEAVKSVAAGFPTLAAAANIRPSPAQAGYSQPSPPVAAAGLASSAPVVARDEAPAQEKQQGASASPQDPSQKKEETIAKKDDDRNGGASCVKDDLQQKKDSPEPLQDTVTLQLRNVKGDVSFSLTCSASSTVSELRTSALAAAPPEQKVAGAVATLVFQGKLLQDGSACIADLGIKHGAMVVIVIKAPK